MKVLAAALALLVASASAFAPTVSRTNKFQLPAKAASSKEEDLELTRQVIAQFVGSKEEGSEAPAPAPPKKEEESKKDE